MTIRLHSQVHFGTSLVLNYSSKSDTLFPNYGEETTSVKLTPLMEEKMASRVLVVPDCVGQWLGMCNTRRCVHIWHVFAMATS